MLLALLSFTVAFSSGNKQTNKKADGFTQFLVSGTDICSGNIRILESSVAILAFSPAPSTLRNHKKAMSHHYPTPGIPGQRIRAPPNARLLGI